MYKIPPTRVQQLLSDLPNGSTTTTTNEQKNTVQKNVQINDTNKWTPTIQKLYSVCNCNIILFLFGFRTKKNAK